MNENNNLPKVLPESKSCFQVDVTGNLTRKRYLGEFVCKIQTIKDQCLIERHSAMLNGPMVEQLPPGVIKMHKMVAHLRYTLIEPYPKFWTESDLGYELMDSNVIEDIYNQVLEFEKKYVDAIWGKSEEVVAETQK